MIEFGKSLREAREAKGLTIRQLAEITRMAPTTIQELESENFSRIAAPIYGRGFVKLYCSAVDLPSADYVEEFMNLYNGNHESSIRERPLREQPAPETAPDTEIAAEPPVSIEALSTPLTPPVPEPETASDLFRQEPEPRPAPLREPEPAPLREPGPAPMPEPEAKLSAAPQEPSLSRYAAPVRQAHASFEPHVYFRLGLLGAGVLVIIALVVFGIRAVYRATTHTADSVEPITAPVAEPPPAPAPKPAATPAAKPTDTVKPQPSAAKTARTPQKIPSLYID